MRDCGALVAILCTALAACFPDFEFGGTGGQGGEPSTSRAGPGPTVGSGGRGAGGDDGGQGGIAGHVSASASTTTDTSTSTGPGGPTLTVPCGDGAGTIVECATRAEGCCLSLEAQSMDHCEATDDCGSTYYTLSCNGPADCSGAICCALFDDFWGDFLGVLQCQPDCTGANYVVCTADGDCAAGETCGQLFSNTFAPEYAPHYRICE